MSKYMSPVWQFQVFDRKTKIFTKLDSIPVGYVESHIYIIHRDGILVLVSSDSFDEYRMRSRMIIDNNGTRSYSCYFNYLKSNKQQEFQRIGNMLTNK